ncbi:MAG: thioredoxin family protein [Niabella sp.]
MIKYLTVLIFISFLSIPVFAQTAPPSADEVLQQAFSKAKAEKKNVFIIFHASWCGWCHKMDAAINDAACQQFFNDNYVIEHLTILESADKKQLENPGAEELYKKYAPESAGIPFWLIYDADGKLIADSRLPDGNNMGCPAAANEVEYFIQVLKKSSKIDVKTARKVFDRFRKNEPAQKS